MTTEEVIENTLKKEGFKVRKGRKKKKVDIRKEGFDEDIRIEDDRDVVIIITEYLKDITHNLTFRNLKRTGKLMMNIFKWLRNKKKDE